VQRSRVLAVELGLPLVDRGSAQGDLLLTVSPDGLELSEVGTAAPGPIRIDFVKGGIGHRRLTASRRQPLARAVGLRRGPSRVVDATAGLGRDAFLLASLGCVVTAIERSPVLGAMLQDAWERAGRSPRIDAGLRGRLRFAVGDARAYLESLGADQRPDVVYVDPMYPPRRKSALSGKEMRILRRLVGDDPDAGALLDVARRVAGRRVVVKRLPGAPALGGGVERTYAGKMARYDVYLGVGQV
jgi:16S rRNA (guanine1516-N2)-methyltransferase